MAFWNPVIEFAELKPGRMYAVHITYTFEQKVFEREFRACFREIEPNGCAMFALRPLAGLLAIPRSWVIDIREERNKPPYLPKVPS